MESGFRLGLNVNYTPMGSILLAVLYLNRRFYIWAKLQTPISKDACMKELPGGPG